MANTAPFEETSQQWRVVGKTVSNLTGARLEPQTSRSRDERVTLLKFLGPADPKNPGQRPLTRNFWVKIFESL